MDGRRITQEDIDSRFTYHPPKEGQPAKYETLRNTAKELAEMIVELGVPGRETSTAVTKVEEAIMWANAGIARHG